MEERSKEDLYAIRAAMSLISQKTDVTRSEERGIASSNDKIKKSDAAIVKHRAESMQEAEKQYGVATRLREIEKRMEPLEREIAEKEEPIKKEKAEIVDIREWCDKKYSRKFPLVICFLLAAVCFTLVMTLLVMRLALGLPYGTATGYGILSGCGISFVITVIYALIRRSKKLKWQQRWNDRYSRNVTEPMSNLQPLKDEFEKLEQEKNQLLLLQKKGALYFDDEAVEKIREGQKQYAASLAPSKKAETQAIAERQIKINQIAKESQEIIENAQKLYPVIDFRDWENVDLIIFYYETGRADTMKEALQQVDRQRQNETLVKAVGMATEMIAKTIQQSVGSLEKTLDNSFRKLSVQLEFQHQTSLEEVSKLGAKLEAQNDRLEKLNEQAEELRLSAEAQARIQATNQAMTNALLDKINVSSTQLAYDMDKQLKLVHHIPV